MPELLLLPPILKGFAALLAAGAAFPLTGVMVMRLDLLPLRYTLMHGMILGGAISLALSLPPLLAYIASALLTAGAMLIISRGRMKLSSSSAIVMVLSMAIAMIISEKADVPSKDMLSMLWGSPFTISIPELIAFIALSLLIVLYTALSQRKLALIFFDRDIAYSSDRHIRIHEGIAVLLTALTVALSMRFVGALLIDALLILPAIVASKRAGSLRSLFVLSSLIGFASALIGYLAALYADIAPSAAVAIVSALLYIAIPRRKN